MTNEIKVISAKKKDFKEIWKIFKAVISKGDTYTKKQIYSFDNLTILISFIFLAN